MEERDFSEIVEEKKELLDQSFRDSVATISKQGKRNYIFPKKPKGKFYNLRTLTSIVYLVVFFTLPFIKVDEEPLFMFNVLERKFIFFGQVFWPQDFFIFAIGLLTFIVFIIFFTVVFGRVFCGWVCPQTIFMEMVFRKIEYWIEGDHTKQKQLDASEWTTEKTLRKSAKFFVFFLISFLFANTFLAYIISIDKLKLLATEGPAKHIGGFISITAFTF